MAKYIVSIPIVMLVSNEVEANAEDEAIELALQHLEHMLVDVTTLDHHNDELGEWELEEWEGHKKIVEGNVINTYNHTAYAQKG